RHRGIEQVICARLEDVRFPAGSIASAGMFDVLEHIEDDLGALRAVRTILRSGGHLFLTVPAYNLLHSEDDVAAGHFRRYTVSSLTRVLREAGFQIAYSGHLFGPLP